MLFWFGGHPDPDTLTVAGRVTVVGVIAIDRFVQQGFTESEWEVPDEVLVLFPDDVRAYFRPRRATDLDTQASLRGQNPSAANS